MKEIKCIAYLLKCSKYLYYAKKLVCLATIGFALVLSVSYFSSEKCFLKRLKEMM